MSHDYSDKLLVTDMDGTLIDKNGNISEKNKAAIKEFISGGGLFTFATGRSQSVMRHFAKEIGANAPAILYNGGMFYDFSADRVLEKHCIDDSAETIIRKVAESMPDMAIEIHKDGEIYEYRENKYTEYHINVVHFTPIYITDPSEVAFPWMKVGFWFESDRYDALKSFVEPLCNENIHFLRTHKYAAELVNVNADKGNLICRLREMYKDRTIIACGDNENDLLMLKNADNSYCPANAFDCAKKTAAHCLDSDCDHDFLSDVIKRIR